MRYHRKIILTILVAFILLYFAPALLGGYTYSANTAIKKSFPFQSGEIVYEKDFGKRKVVICDTGLTKYVKLVNHKWGILYRVDNISAISSITNNEAIGSTWSARLTKDKRYDTIFGVQVVDDKIVQIIISNDSYGDKLESKEEIRKNSALYIEMPVKNGYAANYSNLSISDTGPFVFRGVDSSGRVITVKE